MIGREVTINGIRRIGSEHREIILKRDRGHDYHHLIMWFPNELVADWQIGDKFTVTLAPVLPTEDEITIYEETTNV